MGAYTLKDPDRIPTAAVAPVLEYAFSKWEFWKQNERGRGSKHMERSSGHHIVAALAASEYGGSDGTWAKRLRSVMNQEFETCSLNFVDHILITMGMHQLWYSPPLSDYYFSPEAMRAA